MAIEAGNRVAVGVSPSDAEYAVRLRAPGVEGDLLRSIAQMPLLPGTREAVCSEGSSNSAGFKINFS